MAPLTALAADPVSLPGWAPQPDVWLLVGLAAAGYWIAMVRLGPALLGPDRPVVSRFQTASFAVGLFAIFVASVWPVHDIAEQYLFSVHMVQHLIYTTIAAPLLVMGTPAWLMRWLLQPEWLLRTVRFLARFFPATILFNVVLVLTHWPVVVDTAVRYGVVHFLVHALILVTALILWLPVLSPLPEVPRLAPVMRMLFLFLQSIVPTVPASFLTFGTTPLYEVYEEFPRLWGFSVLDDMHTSGLIMKIGAGLILWVFIATIFFRWYSEEEAKHVAPRRVPSAAPPSPAGADPLGSRQEPTR